MVDTIETALIMGTLCALAWSIMYKLNIGYRFAEDLTVGVMGGYILYSITDNTMSNFITPLIKGDLLNIVPIVIGVVLWGQLLKPSQRWVARAPLAFITGVGSAVALKGAVYGNILTYIQSMSTPPGYDPYTFFNWAIAGLATITSVTYFFFTVKHTGAFKPVTTLGRFFMMVGFGSIAGSSVLSNTTFIYNRAQWFVVTPYAWVPLAIVGMAIVVDLVRSASRKQS